MAILLHRFRQLRQSIPFGLACRFDSFGIILVFGVIVGALIKELRIHFHEQLHSIVYHAMDSSVENVSKVPFVIKNEGTHRFQWPFEFSYKGANMIGKITSTLSLTRLQKYSLFQK